MFQGVIFVSTICMLLSTCGRGEILQPHYSSLLYINSQNHSNDTEMESKVGTEHSQLTSQLHTTAPWPW